MGLTPTALAEAFSGHRFVETYPQIADHVEWILVGGPTLEGRQALVEACENTVHELAGTSTTFTKFRTVVCDLTVVVDSTAAYREPDGTTTVVGSCDLYDFDADDRIVMITSYTVELPNDEPGG